jgi:hypothetical protein
MNPARAGFSFVIKMRQKAFRSRSSASACNQVIRFRAAVGLAEASGLECRKSATLVARFAQRRILLQLRIDSSIVGKIAASYRCGEEFEAWDPGLNGLGHLVLRESVSALRGVKTMYQSRSRRRIGRHLNFV